MIDFDLAGQVISVPEELLERYNKQGPRYTSYPTAPEWSEEVDINAYVETLEKINFQTKALSLYVHIPFCERACYFCACNTIITQKRSLADEYLTYLEKELARLGELTQKRGRIAQLQWGGGTPTYLNPAQLERLFHAIEKNFTVDKSGELSLEIHPNVTTNEQMITLSGLGFNRLSMGVQDFDDEVQKAVNRIEKRERVQELVLLSRKLGFKSVNVDLIYGLPLQSAFSFEKTIDAIIEISPDRIALFNYAHVPWLKPFQKYIRENDLPSGRMKFDIFRMAIAKLTSAGYQFIGLDHFAKPDDELVRAQENHTLKRNFMGYTTHLGTYLLGVGESSIGMMNDVYVQNEKKLIRYQELIKSRGLATVRGMRLSTEDQLRRHVIMNILCHTSLNYAEIEAHCNISFAEHFAHELEQLPKFVEDGLLVLKSDGFDITPLGRILVRNIAMVFDAYLRKPSPQKRLFSKTL